MKENVKQLLEQILENEGIRVEDIPNIDLYMDQVTTFMNDQLSGYKRYPEDKILTKTMINNYSKNHLLPPSNKKKYSKEHLILLILIYYYKNILSISDIQNLLSMVTGDYFPEHSNNGITMKKIYGDLTELMDASGKNTRMEILRALDESDRIIMSEAEDPSVKMNEEDRETLALFTFISHLCYDIYIRKQLIEKLLDQKYPKDTPARKKKK